MTLASLQEGAQVHGAHDMASLFELLDRHPDVDAVVVDLRMPGMAGHQGLVRLRERLRGVPVVVLSASDDLDDIYTSLSSGASGYVHKGASAQTLQEAIRTVSAGGVYLPRALLAREAKADDGAHMALSPRQQQVFDLLVLGHSNKLIAYDLGMSEGTVKAHVSAIMKRFDVGNRVQLLRAAQRAGLLSPGPAA